MASPQVQSIDWGDVVTTTLENRSKTLADNITNNNALLEYISTETFDGGREIIQELSYGANQTFMFYSGYEFLNVSLNDTMTAARYPIKQAAISVVLSGLEQIQNSGMSAMKNLIQQRVKNAEATFWNQMSAAIYSDGTGWGGKQINGLAAMISKAPTSGVVGGIDRASQVWWRNVSVNANTDARGLITATNVQSYFNSTCIGLKRNSQGVDTIVADNNIYLSYLSSLQAIQRITTDRGKQGIGFTGLKYFGAGKEVDVILDGGKNGQIPTNTAYFINSEYIHYRPYSGRNFKVIGGDRQNINQDAIVRLMGWAGNLTTDGPQYQAVLWQ